MALDEAQHEPRKVHPPSPHGRGVGGEGVRPCWWTKRALPADLLAYARNLRDQQTPAEAVLWDILRNRNFCGAKFRRQHPIGRYIVDFYCDEAKLIVELDGGEHNTDRGRRYDSARTRVLESAGLHVSRFWNDDVFNELESLLDAIFSSLELRRTLHGHTTRVSGTPSPPTPLPKGEGRRRFSFQPRVKKA